MIGSSQSTPVGWFEKVRDGLQFDKIADKLNLSKYRLLDLALFFGVGFLIGFVWKRYANYVIAILLFIVFLVILQQLDVVNVQFNWVKIQECCGIKPIQTGTTDILGAFWMWAKANILIIFSFAIGFCFGAKVS